MKKILKLFGLPKSGTCVMLNLLNLNFTNYTCQLAEFNTDFYGWKHGTPKSVQEYKQIQTITDEKLLFVFTYRDFDSWKQSIYKDHIGSWEFPFSFYKEDKLHNGLIFNTPMGPEIYNSFEDLYCKKTTAYQQFCDEYTSNTIIIDFQDIKNNKVRVLESIKEKFNLQQAEDFWVTLDKKHIFKNNVFFDI
jgi:hypothetical protein